MFGTFSLSWFIASLAIIKSTEINAILAIPFKLSVKFNLLAIKARPPIALIARLMLAVFLASPVKSFGIFSSSCFIASAPSSSTFIAPNNNARLPAFFKKPVPIDFKLSNGFTISDAPPPLPNLGNFILPNTPKTLDNIESPLALIAINFKATPNSNNRGINAPRPFKVSPLPKNSNIGFNRLNNPTASSFTPFIPLPSPSKNEA